MLNLIENAYHDMATKVLKGVTTVFEGGLTTGTADRRLNTRIAI